MARDQRPDPVIILGAPRSGTTYLNKILNSHPDVYISHEARVFVFLHEILNILPADDRLLVTHRDEFVAHLRRVLPDVIRDFYRDLAGAAVWGDKNPHYADSKNLGCLNSIAQLFPGTRFLHIIRDGRDVVASLLQRKHQDGTPWVAFDSAHHTWINHVAIARDFAAHNGPLHYLEVRYEDLVDDDVAVTKLVFEFLEIEFSDEVRRFCEAQREQRTPFSSPTRDLNDVRASTWATCLGPEEQVQSMRFLRPHLKVLGYTT